MKFLLNIKIKNIVISGNNYLNDDYIINLAGIKKYPSFLMLNSQKVCKKVESSKYIKTCQINKKLGFVLRIKIVENRPLFYDVFSNKYILSDYIKINNDSINNDFKIPRLLNYVPDKKYNKFIKSMSLIDKDTISKISDIEYKSNEFDKDRFLLYMDDGNMVYLTLTKFKMINHYNDVLSQLEGHKGILYLDSGNHFKIME